MTMKRIDHNHVDTLRSKINSTEAALDNYKDTHPFLYATNSYYLEKLKQELLELEKSYKGDKNLRKFSRIKMQRAVYLDFCSTQYHGLIEDISPCGFFVNGEFKRSKGDICRIYLKESEKSSEPTVCAIGSISRAGGNGIALEFIAMKPKSYLRLKAALLRHAPDSTLLKDEIAKQSFYIFSKELVCSRMFSSKRAKLKKLLHNV
ncbi:MAG: PilZ domain-containing protein [Candidatus Electrothrix sp. MAN1_4]|nr:PilZ domain-containing protein [Candidatus Electrothrix sp. MAN1_4]